MDVRTAFIEDSCLDKRRYNPSQSNTEVIAIFTSEMKVNTTQIKRYRVYSKSSECKTNIFIRQKQCSNGISITFTFMVYPLRYAQFIWSKKTKIFIYLFET